VSGAVELTAMGEGPSGGRDFGAITADCHSQAGPLRGKKDFGTVGVEGLSAEGTPPGNKWAFTLRRKIYRSYGVRCQATMATQLSPGRRRGPGRRPPDAPLLDRHAILEAALQLVDEEGL